VSLSFLDHQSEGMCALEARLLPLCVRWGLHDRGDLGGNKMQSAAGLCWNLHL